ncbi:MAG: DUF3782 domain-containing protein, partial [Candidatus Binatia bacterium]|nr:DUF3782 domain-containing protein [Candidatus Binatia bacterium]
MSIIEILERFPPELRQPLAQLLDALKEEWGVKRVDIEDLKAIVRDLAQAQQRTEARVEELAQAQKELAEAQRRTEARVEELAQAQLRTEARVEELTQAQKELAEAQTRFAHIQQRQAEELAAFRRTFDAKVGGLGARWGLQSEEAFRQGMRAILREVGFVTERFLDFDTAGEVFGYPEYIELDVVVKNGKVIVVEIKSSLDKGNAYLFERKATFYTRKTGRQIDRKIVVTPYADRRALEV